jgi:isoamylase
MSDSAAVPGAQLRSHATPRRVVRPGEPLPLGATWDGRGTNFSVFSEVAERVELCLFDEGGTERRVDLPERTAFCWHGYLRGVRPGQRYGFRVHGPWEPDQGSRCNPAKLLLDPYARAVCGDIQWGPALFPYPLGGDDRQRDDTDSAPHVPKGIVVDDPFDWEGDTLLRRPLHETVIYEVHVKGFTKRHPGVPEPLRGTYAGLAHPAAIEHLTRLGVTAVELLPIHQFVHESHQIEKGLRNYWGYHSIAFLAPHGEYSSAGDSGGQVREFKTMVKALHAAGLEVILDVVYNHTGEGNHLGPMLSLKGFDNRAYYRTVPDDARFYMDYTGTGNSLNMRHPHALQLVMDSLRYWVQAMHVDGFRFDLASTLARELFDVDRLSAFFDIIHQDPILSSVKLIAEPWDLGEGGYQVGNFPVRWCEWNGKYRDTVRDFWRGEGQTLPEFAFRLTGSADLYQHDGRKPHASVNFVTAHDGFTLRDLVSYNEKHNEANGENNQDGESHNRSWNCGAEGPTSDPEVNALRARQARNLLTTVLLSQGIPMILGGDELGRTQGGNNNAYCQDNEISWFDWESADGALLEFTRRVVHVMRTHPVFQRRRWFQGRQLRGAGVLDIVWFRFDGQEMSEQDWHAGFIKSFAVFLNGDALRDTDADGNRLRDDSFLLVFNAHHGSLPFTIPPRSFGEQWSVVIDTASDRGDNDAARKAAESFEVQARSMLVLSRPPQEAAVRQTPAAAPIAARA